VRTAPGHLSLRLERVLGPLASQLLLKEVRRLKRSTRDWSHWMLALLGAGVYLAALSGVPKPGADALSLVLVRILALVSIGVGGLLLASVSTHSLLPGLYREKSGLWVLGSAPSPWRALVRVQYGVGVASLLPLAVGATAASGVVLGAGAESVALTSLSSAASAALVVALGVWFSARFPQLEARSATAVAASPVAILFILSSLLLVALSVAAAAPLVLPADQAAKAGVGALPWASLAPSLGWLLWGGAHLGMLALVPLLLRDAVVRAAGVFQSGGAETGAETGAEQDAPRTLPAPRASPAL
jgi:hypothetical protein